MSDSTYHLSVPIDDPKVHRKLVVAAKEHNAKGKLAPFVLEIITRFLDGEFVRISPTSTRQRAHAKRRIE